GSCFSRVREIKNEANKYLRFQHRLVRLALFANRDSAGFGENRTEQARQLKGTSCHHRDSGAHGGIIAATSALECKTPSDAINRERSRGRHGDSLSPFHCAAGCSARSEAPN